MNAILKQTLATAEEKLDADGQARLAELARPLLGALPEGIYRDLLIDRLAEEVGLSAERLSQRLGSGNDNPGPQRRPVAPAETPIGPGPKSLIRKAVCLALQQPSAAAAATVPDGVLDLPNPGIALLTDLIDSARGNPGLKPARLADELAGHPDGGSHLQRLLVQDLQLEPDANWQLEIEQTLGAILKQELERQIGALNSRAGSLSDAEKEELRELYSQLSGLHGSPR